MTQLPDIVVEVVTFKNWNWNFFPEYKTYSRRLLYCFTHSLQAVHSIYAIIHYKHITTNYYMMEPAITIGLILIQDPKITCKTTTYSIPSTLWKSQVLQAS
uniref:Uncharacterized protein n=1 Tax=Micrurus corallinus TaxID=54390 RepID=A0A2D4FVY5_MICCO